MSLEMLPPMHTKNQLVCLHSGTSPFPHHVMLTSRLGCRIVAFLLNELLVLEEDINQPSNAAIACLQHFVPISL